MKVPLRHPSLPPSGKSPDSETDFSPRLESAAAALQQLRASSPGALSAASVTTLGRTIGNRALTKLLSAKDPTGMPPAVRQKMERSLGADFSEVRVRVDSPLAVALGALAYTRGSEIHFAPGQWAPQSPRGQQVLGHELSHVLQQRQGRVQATAQADGVALNDEPTLEREADTVGALAASGASARSAWGADAGPGTGGASAIVQRKPVQSASNPNLVIDEAIRVEFELVGEDARWIRLRSRGVEYYYDKQEALYRTVAQAEQYEADLASHPVLPAAPLTGNPRADRAELQRRRDVRAHSLRLSTIPPAILREPRRQVPSRPVKGLRPFDPTRRKTLRDLRGPGDDRGPGGPGQGPSGGSGGLAFRSAGSSTVTIEQERPDAQPAPSGVQTSRQQGQTEDLRLTLRLRPPGSQREDPAPHQAVNAPPEQIQAAPDQALIDAFRRDLLFGQAWGDDAAAGAVANTWGVRFMIHHVGQGGYYNIVVGNGGAMYHLLHRGNHYEVLVFHADRVELIRIPGDGSCLFASCFRAVMGRLPTLQEIQTLRALAAQGLTPDQIRNIIIVLRNENGLAGVGPELGSLLRPERASLPGQPERLMLILRLRPRAPDVGQTASLSSPGPILSQHLQARAEARAAQTAAFHAQARDRSRPQMTPPQGHFDALIEAREAQTRALIEHGRQAALARAQRAEPVIAPRPAPRAEPIAAPVDFEPPLGLTAIQATQFVLTHLPAAPDVNVRQYINARRGELVDAGFVETNEQRGLLQEALAYYRGMSEAELAARRARFDPFNPDTWEMDRNGVRYLNGMNEEMVTAARDGAGRLRELARGQLQPRHGRPAIGQLYHQHLAGGSWGLAFMYVVNRDFTVTAYVIDIAYSRASNQYNWQTGGNSYEPTKAQLPKGG